MVVDPPSNIICPGLSAVTPPRVGFCGGIRVQSAETSTQPCSSNKRVSHARSSGKKPEFFWLLFQFFKSISLWAMFQSPQITSSLPSAMRSAKCGKNSSIKRNLASCRSGEEEPDGQYTEITDRSPKSQRT